MGEKREKTKYLHILFSIMSVAYHRLKIFLRSKIKRGEEVDAKQGGKQSYFYFRHLISKVKSNETQNCQPWVHHVAPHR